MPRRWATSTKLKWAAGAGGIGGQNWTRAERHPAASNRRRAAHLHPLPFGERGARTRSRCKHLLGPHEVTTVVLLRRRDVLRPGRLDLLPFGVERLGRGLLREHRDGLGGL